MKKGKRAGGRSPRTPRGATRGVVPKRSEGRRQSRDPFKTDWHYLDTTDLGTTPKTAATERGGVGKDDKGKARRPVSPNVVASQKTPRAQALVYWEPTKAFLDLDDDELALWFVSQPLAYQDAVIAHVGVGNPFKEFFAHQAVLVYLRKMGAPLCTGCGWDGAPTGGHVEGCRGPKPKRKFIDLPEDVEEDDDLPF